MNTHYGYTCQPLWSKSALKPLDRRFLGTEDIQKSLCRDSLRLHKKYGLPIQCSFRIGRDLEHMNE